MEFVRVTKGRIDQRVPDLDNLTAAWMSTNERHIICFFDCEMIDYVTVNTADSATAATSFVMGCSCAKDGVASFLIEEFKEIIIQTHLTCDRRWNKLGRLIHKSSVAPFDKINAEHAVSYVGKHATLLGYHKYKARQEAHGVR